MIFFQHFYVVQLNASLQKSDCVKYSERHRTLSKPLHLVSELIYMLNNYALATMEME